MLLLNYVSSRRVRFLRFAACAQVVRSDVVGCSRYTIVRRVHALLRKINGVNNLPADHFLQVPVDGSLKLEVCLKS